MARAQTFAFATARDTAAALVNRDVSAVELCDAAIGRIEALDKKINAVVVRDFERARKAAAEADARLKKGERAPLLGVPMTVKEAHNVAGLPTTWGLPGTGKNIARDDGIAVARLKRAGAIVLGKTNVPVMLADWQSFNPIYGTTNNPYDLARTPGGSSGGSAAALAAGFVPLELGTDMAGSIRVPAHCCGVFGHKSTHGIVPQRGCAPPGVPTLSVTAEVDFAAIGPMARTAKDLALGLEVIAGPDEDEAAAYRLALPKPRHEVLKDFRVLVLQAHPLGPTSASVRGALDHFSAKLEKVGAKVVRSAEGLPNLSRIGQLFGELLMAQFAADNPGASKLSHGEWIARGRERAGIAHQWNLFFRDFDVVLSPVLPVAAFPKDERPMEQRTLVVDGKALPYAEQSFWITPASFSGLPATSMPVGLDEEGLPIGIQVIGARFADLTTIRFAALAEREFGGFVAPKGFA